MYVQKQFEQKDLEAMHALINANPLGALVISGPNGFSANHFPFELVTESAPYGMLFGHVARTNPVWTEVQPDAEALVIFQGSNAYISPSWYPSKKASGRVVPTWNYVVVHAHGRIRAIDDADWVRTHIERLTNREESRFSQPWALSDAPVEFTAKMINAVVGIEIQITRLVGKWKVSQNRSDQDRDGVAKSLRMLGEENAQRMADYIENAKPTSQ